MKVKIFVRDKGEAHVLLNDGENLFDKLLLLLSRFPSFSFPAVFILGNFQNVRKILLNLHYFESANFLIQQTKGS
jgi:hypothetical protein